ncbi:MAG: DUF721 domain-containing protein [Sphingobacteriales bacterium]|nr:DUF721 domain-containing protein [Sphingobacteriales bacterium]
MKRNSNEQSLGEVLRHFLKENELQDKLHEAKVIALWEELMGEAIVRHTAAVSLRQGKLLLRITSAPLRQELLYARERIAALFNEKLGTNLIREVVVM